MNSPYLTLMSEEAPQREHSLRKVFNGLRYIARSSVSWMIPNDLPPRHTVYQQTRRWLKAGVFALMVHDLCALLRAAQGRQAEPSAAILDSRTLQSTPESGERAGYDGAKRKRGSKTHMAVDTLGYLLALFVTPADEQNWAHIEQLAREVQVITGESVELAFVDQGYTGKQPAEDAARHGMQLEVIKLLEAKKGFVLLPRHWVERSFAWTARFCRLAHDYERLPETLQGLHYQIFAILMLRQFVKLMAQSA